MPSNDLQKREKRQMNYSNFEQGDIVVAELLFSDQIGVKRRPALVVSNKIFNHGSKDVIVLKITSAIRKTRFDITLTNKDLVDGKLKKDSFIRVGFPATIEKQLITQQIGKISRQKLLEIRQKMKELYDI